MVDIGFDRSKYNENSDKIAPSQTMEPSVMLMLTQINVTDWFRSKLHVRVCMVLHLNRIQIGLGDDRIMEISTFNSNFSSILLAAAQIDHTD